MSDPNSIDPNNLEQTTPAESQPEAPIDPQPADQAQPDPTPEEATPPTEPAPPQIVPGEEPFVLPSGVTCVMCPAGVRKPQGSRHICGIFCRSVVEPWQAGHDEQ